MQWRTQKTQRKTFKTQRKRNSKIMKITPRTQWTKQEKKKPIGERGEDMKNAPTTNEEEDRMQYKQWEKTGEEEEGGGNERTTIADEARPLEYLGEERWMQWTEGCWR